MLVVLQRNSIRLSINWSRFNIRNERNKPEIATPTSEPNSNK